MKKHLFLFAALMAAFVAQAATFSKLDNSQFGSLETGDQVVLTVVFDGKSYAVSAGDAIVQQVSVSNDAVESPEATLVFNVEKTDGGYQFKRSGDTQLYMIKDSKGVKVAKPGSSAVKVWNFDAEHDHLYAELEGGKEYLGLYRKGADSLKVFFHAPYSENKTTNYYKMIRDEVFALYVNRPHKITLADVEGGTLTSSLAFANQDDVVEITLAAHKGFDYVENSLTYTYNDGTQDVISRIEDNQFFMPAFDVTVTAEFDGHDALATFDFTAAGNPWGFPTSGARLLEKKDYTNGTQTVTVEGTGNIENNGGYTWNSWGGGYLLFGKKGASITLPAFDYNVSKIIVTGRSLASEKTGMNIYVGENAASQPTIGSTEENVYLIAREYREKGNRYALTVLNDNPAQVTLIDVFGTVPGAPEVPEVDVPGGLYKEPKEVKISCITEGADIRYTTDGSRPTETSPKFSGTILVNKTMTIRAVAVKGGVKSEIMTAKYAIANVTAEGTVLNPYSVADVQALGNPGWKAWVHGYIIGGFDAGLKVRALDDNAANAIAIADDPEEIDLAKMVIVELPQGKVRNALNIPGNPTLKKHKVWVYGVLSAYGGKDKPGVSKTSKYYLNEEDIPTAIKNEQLSTVNSQRPAIKVLRDGQLLILRDGEIYTITGQRLQ